MSSFRDASKKQWVGPESVENINAGSLQRIADAVETMAQHYKTLIEQRDMYKRWYAEKSADLDRERRRTAALRGVIGRMKRSGE